MNKGAVHSIRYLTPLRGDTHHHFNVDQIRSESDIPVGRIFYKLIGKSYFTFVSHSVSVLGITNVRFYFLTRFY